MTSGSVRCRCSCRNCSTSRQRGSIYSSTPSNTQRKHPIKHWCTIISHTLFQSTRTHMWRRMLLRWLDMQFASKRAPDWLLRAFVGSGKPWTVAEALIKICSNPDGCAKGKDAYRNETQHDMPAAIFLPRAGHKQQSLDMSSTGKC